MRKFILTDAQGTTANGKLLAAGKNTHVIGAEDDHYQQVAKLCADSAVLAVMLNPNHMPGTGQRLFQIDQWEVSVASDNPRAYTVIKEHPLPNVSTEQKLIFAFLSLAQVYRDLRFLEWMDNWLSGADRSAIAAHAIEEGATKEIEAADTLDVLKAHGDISPQDLQNTEEKANHARRVIALTRAAQLAGSNDPAAHSEVAKLVAMTTVGLSLNGKRVELGPLAQQAMQSIEKPRARASM